MTSKKLEDCFDFKKQEQLRKKIAEEKGSVLLIGTGASLICKGDLLIYFDINRWELQLRFRTGASNWLWSNRESPNLEKYKRGFFIEWRLADRYKDYIYQNADFMVDSNDAGNPKMITLETFKAAFHEASCKPFRMQPYFDPGVWGGQWMKYLFDLNPKEENYAWSFDGVPEENSINFEIDGKIISFPMMNMTLLEPKNFLGHRVFARFGREFPIRFDLLDTMDGQNLSLQVHPLTEYIQKNFGMHYTQDESYYILDAKEDACVYIGVKEGINKDEMYKELQEAQRGGKPFDAEKYVNKVPVKKHDHILIPAGTVHCSGKNAMVLEISATPYIFTFKLWDWGRIGLDGLPRPIHIDHGIKNIQFDRTLDFVEKELIHQNREIAKGIEITGLHELEFIETKRYSTDSVIEVEMLNGVNVLNLVDGKAATIESLNGEFEPFEVHYAETFIVPASVGKYKIKASDGLIKMLVASVRG